MADEMFGTSEESKDSEHKKATPAAGEDRELDNFVRPKPLERKRTEIEDMVLDQLIFEIRSPNNDGNKGSEGGLAESRQLACQPCNRYRFQ